MSAYHFHVTQIKRSKGQSQSLVQPIGRAKSSFRSITTKSVTTPESEESSTRKYRELYHSFYPSGRP